MLKPLIKRIPVVGPWVHRVYRRRSSRRPHVHQRLDLDAPGIDAPERARRQVLNMLDYTKTSGQRYSARSLPAGYHSIELDGIRFSGQRDPRQRVAQVPLDFSGKTVLDIGCNQGGMLFELADRIHHGVGIDYDARMINAANRIRSHRRIGNLDFFVFNLEREDLNIIRDLLPGPRVDVALLLSVCQWIRNWRELIAFTAAISPAIVFDLNP